MNKYVFKPYNRIFPTLFNKEKERILSGVKNLLAIEHIGSTAVPHLGGKGIIDIAIAVKREDMDASIENIQALGYEYRPSFSTAERYYFVGFRPDPEEGERRYHIHLTFPESSEWRELIGFRDYLRHHPEAVEEYAQMKERAANEANQEGARYRAMKQPMFDKAAAYVQGIYHLESYDHIPKKYEEILYHGISEAAHQAKGLSPISPYSIFIKDKDQNVLGGISGTYF